MAGVIVSDSIEAGIEIDCLIIGGGAAGLTAALAASEAGESVLVAERDTQLSGSTALSSGLVPAAGTKAQAAQSISDSEDVFVGDIMAKNKNSADPDYVRTIVAQIPKTIDWLADSHNIPFHVLDDFLYPSHSHHRMHAVPEVTGQGLITRLEQAVAVLAQSEQTAFNIFDGRLQQLGRKFEDFRNAEENGAVIVADSPAELATRIGIDSDALEATLDEAGLLAESGEPDGFGRQFSADTLLRAPYCAVRVTGALFHTQGGLLVDDHARVKRADGSVFDSLFACGGAACGVSGPNVSGYLSGNGLLTALALGHLAGGFAGQEGA